MKLFFRSYGKGPPLFILHGLYGSSDNWFSIAKMIGEYFTVYLPDLRNHGQSPHSDIMDYDSMRDDLLELTDELNIKKCFLAGHSMGGKVAISFALKFPERLNGLLIADISPFNNEITGHIMYEQHKSILKAMLSLDLPKINSRAEADAELTKMIETEKIKGFILKNLQRSTGNSFIWRINVRSILKNLDRIMDGIDRGTIRDHQISGFPVIFLKGAESDYLNTTDYPGILRIFPAAEFIEIVDAGHWIHADQPAEVAASLKMLLGLD